MTDQIELEFPIQMGWIPEARMKKTKILVLKFKIMEQLRRCENLYRICRLLYSLVTINKKLYFSVT